MAKSNSTRNTIVENNYKVIVFHTDMRTKRMQLSLLFLEKKKLIRFF